MLCSLLYYLCFVVSSTTYALQSPLLPMLCSLLYYLCFVVSSTTYALQSPLLPMLCSLLYYLCFVVFSTILCVVVSSTTYALGKLCLLISCTMYVERFVDLLLFLLKRELLGHYEKTRCCLFYSIWIKHACMNYILYMYTVGATSCPGERGGV